MFVVVSYDIVDDKRREKVAKILKDYGVRVQYSVFECELDGKYIIRMKKEILAHIDKSTDSLRIYYLTEECKKKIEIYGLGEYTHSDETIVI